MKNVKCPQVTLNRVRDILFEPIERALSVISYMPCLAQIP